KMTLIIRGMPTGRQEYRISLPCPPVAWSARLASKMARYSGVRGACCPRPSGLLESHWMPPVLAHWPPQSGYFDSSCSRATATAKAIAVATAKDPRKLLRSMTVLQSHDGPAEI